MPSRGPGRRPRVGGRVAAVAVLGALTLSACAGIPSSGPVHEAGTIVDERDDPFTRIIAAGPVKGMSPEQIVEGFVKASASFDDNHAVARQFLTTQAARAWHADAGATVYYSDTTQGGSVQFAAVTPGTIRFSAPQAGVLSAQGAYTGSTPGTIATAEFRLTKSGDQWRIATLPAGLLLTTNDVGRAYRSYDIYFPNPSRTVVVPDQILVPVGPGTSTSLVRALLDGPTPWLAKAVRTAVPAGTKLVVDSVPVQNGVVQVDLTSPAANVAREEAQAMSAQFVWTLRQLSGVTTLRLTVDGVPLRVPSVGDTQSIAGWSSFDPDGGAADTNAYAVAKGRAVVLHDNKLEPVRGPLGDGSTVVSQVLPSFDGTQLAALDKDRRRLLVGKMTADAHAQVLLTGSALSPPSWDRFGGVWVADRTRDTSTVWEITPGSAVRKVSVDGLPDGTIRTLRLARDGVRVSALVVDQHGVGQVYVGRVERSEAKLALAGFRLVNTGFVQSVDTAWATADRLVILGQSKPTDAVQPWLVDLNGSVEQGLGPATGGSPMVSVGAAPTHPVLTSTADGTLLWYTGFGWDSSLGTGAFPAYPG